MNKLNIRFKISIGILFVGLCILLSVYINFNIEKSQNFLNTETNEKQIIKGYACLASYTLETATDTAETIIYGKVKDKSDICYDTQNYPEVFRYYKEVTVEVFDTIKGEATENNTITFIERAGGETDDTIYILEGIDPVTTDKEYIFFLNENREAISPLAIVPVSEGFVQTKGKVAPETSYTPKTTNIQPEQYDLKSYLDAIRNELK